jgi:flagellar assembly protein FliH
MKENQTHFSKASKVKILRDIITKSYAPLKPLLPNLPMSDNDASIHQKIDSIDEQLLKAYQEGFQKGLNLGQEQGFREGKIQGIILGMEEGREDSFERLTLIFQTVQNLSSELQYQKEHLLNKIKPELIKFCLGICKKILGHELTFTESYQAMLDHLFSKIGNHAKNQPIIVMISSEDLTLMEGQEERLRQKWHLNNIQFQEDATMTRGKCCLETPMGIVNFDIDRLLKNFESKVLEGD